MGVTIPLPELDLPRPAVNPAPDALSEFQRAAALKTEAARQQAISAQTTGQEQQNQMQAMQLKDEMLRRQLAPQFVQKDDNGKVSGFDNEGLYSAMLSQGADPINIQKMRMAQVEMQKSLLGLSDAKLDHQHKINDEFYNSLEAVRGIQNKTSQEQQSAPAPAAVGAAAPTSPLAAPSSWHPPMALPAQQPAQQPIGAAAPGSPESLGAAEPGAAPTQSESAVHEAAAAPRPITNQAQIAYQKELMRLASLGIPIGQLKPVLTSEADIDQAEAELGLHKQALADAAEIASTQKAKGEGEKAQAEAEAALWKPAGEGTVVNVKTGQLIHGVASPDVEAFKAYVARGGDPLQYPAYKAQQTSQAEAPTRIATAQAEGTARASTEINTKRQETSDAQFQTAIGADERLNRMEKSYTDATQNNNQQAMLALLTDHIGMTLGLQKGARITKDIINEAARSQPLLASIGAKFDDDGYLSGVTLSKNQMKQMLDLGYSARENAWQGALNTAQLYNVNPPPKAVEVYNKRDPNARIYDQTTASGKQVSLAAARQLPQNAGKSDDEIKADIQKHGHIVAP